MCENFKTVLKTYINILDFQPTLYSSHSAYMEFQIIHFTGL